LTQRNLSILLALLFVTDAIIVGALVSVTASPALGIPIALAALAFPFLMFRVVALGLGRVGLLARLSRDYPLRDGAIPPNGSSKISSISVGTRAMRLNNCVVLAADDACLHLKVSVPTVKNAPGTSIPWEQIESISKALRSAKITLFDGGTLWIPWEYAQAESALRDSIERSAD
jgi:hypothetical protein